jgi:hypothetical protein
MNQQAQLSLLKNLENKNQEEEEEKREEEGAKGW